MRFETYQKVKAETILGDKIRKMKKKNLVLKPFSGAKKYILSELYIPQAFQKIGINIENPSVISNKEKEK